jgi:hypothetical protein
MVRPIREYLVRAALAAMAAMVAFGASGAHAGPRPLLPPPDGWTGPDSGSGFLDPEAHLQPFLDRARNHHGHLANQLSMVTSRMQPGGNPRLFDLADRIRALLAAAKSAIDMRRPEQAFPPLHQAEILFAELRTLESQKHDAGTNPGGMPKPDPYRDGRHSATTQNALADAQSLLRRVEDHLLRFRDRTASSSGDERIANLQARIQDLLDKSREALAAGKAESARELSLKAEALLAELHLAAGGRGAGGKDPSLRRLGDRLQRLSDQLRRRRAEGGDSDKGERLSAAASLIEQAREALTAGKADAAEGLMKQAERLVADSGGPGGGRLSAVSMERLRAKLEKAGSLVSSSGSEKASRIMEKGMEHFAKAERYRGEGQAARAEVEMDIALKLAAKAVDIARAARR